MADKLGVRTLWLSLHNCCGPYILGDGFCRKMTRLITDTYESEACVRMDVSQRGAKYSELVEKFASGLEKRD